MMYPSVKSNAAPCTMPAGRRERRHWFSRAAVALAAATAVIAARPGADGQALADTWDPVPGVAGAGDGAVSGGSGTWDLVSPNWTLDGGLTNQAWTDGNAALFGGASGGIVTVGSGGVSVGALVFDPTLSASGYTIQAPSITDFLRLAGPQVVVNQDATINASISGSAGLTKSGAGTLTLGGFNFFSGPITVNAGRLRVATRFNLGSATSLALDGGALEVTGPMSHGGPMSVGAGGGTLVLSNPSAEFTLTGTLSGGGPLVVDGSGGGALSITGAGNFDGVANAFTGNLSLVGGGSATLEYAIAAPAGQTFSASGGTLTLGNSVPGATVSLGAGSAAQASGSGVVRLSGRASGPGVGVVVGGDVTAVGGGRVEVGDGLDDSSQIRLLGSSRLTADGGTIVLRPRGGGGGGGALSLDATTVGALAVRNGGVLAIGPGATSDVVLNRDVDQAGAWTLANQGGQTLRIVAAAQDTTAGLTLRAEGGVTRYEANTINFGSAAANGTVGVELRGGVVDINADAPGKTFTYSPGYVVSGWGQLGSSAANQTHVIGAGGATFYASGPSALAPTLGIVGGFNESAGGKAGFRIGDNNGLMLTVPNATTASPYTVGGVTIDPQGAGSAARFVVGGGVVQANAGAFSGAANKLRFEVQGGGTLISDVSQTGSLLVNSAGSVPIRLAGGATFSTTSPTFLLNANETIAGDGTLFAQLGAAPTNFTLNGVVDLNGRLDAAVNAASTGTIQLDAGQTLVLGAAADLLSARLTYAGNTAAPATLEINNTTGATVRLGTGAVVSNNGGFAGSREFKVTAGTFQVDAADPSSVAITGANGLSVNRSGGGLAPLGALTLNGGSFQIGTAASTTTVGSGASLVGWGTYGHTAALDTFVNNGLVQASGGQLTISAPTLRASGTWDPNGQTINLTGGLQNPATGGASALVVGGANGGRVLLGAAGNYAGGTTINGSSGTSAVALRVTVNGALGTGGVTLNGGTLQLHSENGLNFGTLPITVTGSAASTINYDRLVSQSGKNNTVGSIAFGGQQLNLTSGNGYHLNVANLTLSPAGGTLSNTGSGNLTVAGTTTLNGNLALSTTSLGMNLGTLSGTGSISRTFNSGTLLFNKAASGFSGNVLTSGGTTRFTGANTLTGGTYSFGGGTVEVNAGGTGALSGATGAVTGGLLNLNTTGALDGTTVTLTGGTVNGNSANALGTGVVQIGGNGNLVLKQNGGASFGGTVVAGVPGVGGANAGNLTVDRSNTSGATGGVHSIAALAINDRQLNLFSGNGYGLSVLGPTTIGGSGNSLLDNDLPQLNLTSLVLDNNLLLAGIGNVTLNQLGGAGNFRIATPGRVSSTGTPLPAFTGTVTISGASLPGFTGTLEVGGGTVNLNNSAALTGGSLVVNGGILNLGAANALVGIPTTLTSGFINASGENALANANLTVQNGSLFASSNNALGNGNLTLTGGNLTATAAGALGAANVTLDNATLALRSDAATAFGGNVTISGTNFSTISVGRRTDAGTTGNRLSINSLSLGGQTLNITGADDDVFAVLNPVTIAGTALTTLNATAADALFLGPVNGAGPLAKSGVRTVTFDAGGSTGATTVSAGTLVVNNVWSSPDVRIGGAGGPATLQLGGAGANALPSVSLNSGTLRIAKANPADAIPVSTTINAGANGDATIEYANLGAGTMTSGVNVDTTAGARKLTLAARSGTAPGQTSAFTFTGPITQTGGNALTVVAQADGTQVNPGGTLSRSPSRMILGGSQTFSNPLQHGGGIVIAKGDVAASGASPIGNGTGPVQMNVMDSTFGSTVADGQSTASFNRAITTATSGAPRMRLGAFYNPAGAAGQQVVNFNGSFTWNDGSFPLVAVATPGNPGGSQAVSAWNGLFAEPNALLQVNPGAVLDNVLTVSGGTTITSTAPVYAGGGGIVRFASGFTDTRNLAAGVGLAGTVSVLDGTTLQSYTTGHHFDAVELRTGTYQVGQVMQSLAGGFAVNPAAFDPARTTGTLTTDFSLNLNGSAGKAFAIAAGQTLVKNGGASLTINGDQLHAAGSTLSANAGTVHVNSDAGMNAGGTVSNKLSLTVGGGATVNLNVNQHVAQVTVSSGLVRLTSASPSGSRVLDATGVLVTGGKLDLTNNRLIVDYTGNSPLTSIRQQLIAGLNAGGAAWSGNGIMSSTAASTASTALGYGEAFEILGASGGTFGSETVDGTSVLVRYTRAGDANLSGAVDFADLLSLAKNYNGTGKHWSQGDFDYDGSVGFADLLTLAKNYSQPVPSEPIPGASAEFNADLALAFSGGAVPEPATVGLLALLGATALTRRTRRRPA